MRYIDKMVLKPPNINTKSLSLLVLLFFISGLMLGSYLFAIDKGEIDSDRFTISQSLAFCNKPIAITLFSLAMIVTLILNYIRGGERFLLYLRYLLIVLSYGLIITIIYVTTFYNKSLHFKFAGVIFLSQLIYIFSVSYIYNNYLDKNSDLLIPVDFNIILIICTFTLLVVFGVFEEDDSSEFRNIIFASSEIITVFLNLLPVLYLGFI
jgi:hypothetical protein